MSPLHSAPPGSFGRTTAFWAARSAPLIGKGLNVIGLDGVSAQALSDTIGAIYDCALDPQQWPDACRKIADLCESTAGGICVHDLRHTQNDQLFVFGYQQQFLEKLGQHYAESPMAASDVVANIGDVNALSMESYDLLRKPVLSRSAEAVRTAGHHLVSGVADRGTHGLHACFPEREGAALP